jgi:hypothetical protein
MRRATYETVIAALGHAVPERWLRFLKGQQGNVRIIMAHFWGVKQ